MRRLLLLLGLSSTIPVALFATRPPAGDAASAIERALPRLAEQNDAWITKHACTSCHQVPHTLWAMNAARARGFEVDERLPEWNAWATQFVVRDTDVDGDHTETAQTRTDELHEMLASGALGESELGREAAQQALAKLLLLAQQDDGLWHAQGQLPEQKRPKQETHEATTLWSLLALADLPADEPRDAVIAHARQRALDALSVASTSTEHLALRTVVLGAERPAEERFAELLEHQNEDGGWGWLLSETSDALGTGHALFALSFAISGSVVEPVRRARQFLVDSQQEDGTWSVPSTLEAKDGEAYEVSNDWGTAWAVLGLARTLPAAR